jgi:hypothetical protein
MEERKADRIHTMDNEKFSNPVACHMLGMVAMFTKLPSYNSGTFTSLLIMYSGF